MAEIEVRTGGPEGCCLVCRRVFEFDRELRDSATVGPRATRGPARALAEARWLVMTLGKVKPCSAHEEAVRVANRLAEMLKDAVPCHRVDCRDTDCVALTRHARRRARQRAIRSDAMNLALQRGMRIEQNGAIVYFLGRRHLPPDLPPAVASRLEGTAVVVGRDGAVVTAYRTHHLPRHLRVRRHRASHHRPAGLHG